jgi:propionyl-CoA carboxylase alpha chain
VHIGPPPANQSYLMIDKIIEACKQTGARRCTRATGSCPSGPRSAEALEKEGIAFIGPKVKAIEAMGDKITSKKIAAEAGVSTVPGHMGLIDDEAHAAKIAAEIGYPVMIKASAGGGGKGMRIAWNDARRARAFPLEIGGRESFRRRPDLHREIHRGAAPYRDPADRRQPRQRGLSRRARMLDPAAEPEGGRGGAVAFPRRSDPQGHGRAVGGAGQGRGYQSAGTVEFIVDKHRNFYFLEMNTRLQVEHPVTELITGVDLVEQMIRVAAGEKLPFTQDDVKLNGWAVESRLYAEDPYRNFLPSIGRLTRYRPPQEGTSDGITIRNDTGVTEGSARSRCSTTR